MEWYVVQTQDLHGIFSSLGSPVGNDYHVGENCLASLGEILACLSSEDRSMRNFRRALGITQVIQTDLIPLLIHAKDDIKVMDATIRVLVNLTLPVECLLPLDSHSQSECGCQTISDLNYLLLSAKEAFVEPRSTQCLVQRMRAAIDKGGNLAPEECESIGNCLLLLRNILHIPERSCRSHGKSHHSPLDLNGTVINSTSSKQNLILWNLFAQNFDKVLLHLMTCPQRAEWEVPMVQLVALTFKDQRMASLLKMLNLWLETSMSSESSEDNESNTSPQPLNQGSDNSSPVLTSEATSDSSDNGAATRGKTSQKGERKSGISSEEESGTCLTARVTRKSDTPNNKNPNESQSEMMSLQLDSSNKEEELQIGGNHKAEAEGESSKEREEEGIQKENVEKGVMSEKRRDDVEEIKDGASGDDGEDGSNGDKDSGVFSEAASPCQPSFRGEKKVHLHPYQRHHHQHHHKQHRYSHHHHCMHHSNSKKESSFATPNSVSSPSNGMAKAASELSDCGYSTQVENQPESLSTSSNEDEGPIAKRSLKSGHQKHHHNIRQHHKVDSNNLTNVNTVHIDKVQKSDIRRKKYVKRTRIRTVNRNVLQHHIPTDDDISNLLKEFTLDFMLQGYGPLVSGLHAKLLSSCTHRAPGIRTSNTASPNPIAGSDPTLMSSKTTLYRSPSPKLPPPPIDTSHFFWLITFFLKFSSQMELELENISMVLSYGILSYLVFEGVGLCEDVTLAIHHCHDSDLKASLRRIHLVVTAIREFVQAVESYGKMAMTIPGREGDRAYLQMLQKQMAASQDLRCLFVLLLQHYKPSYMSKQYLQDVIVANHVLLLFLEGGGDFNEVNSSGTENNSRRRNSLIEEYELKDHIAHFANGSIVQQYGHLLEAFQENGEFVNDCIFTMLHHIGGDISRAETLFQPTLLRAFSAMWEADFDMCDDWSDLIEYIIYKFISNPQQGMNQKNVVAVKSSPQLSIPLLGNLLLTEDKKDTISSMSKWTMEELSNLQWFYALSCKDKNVLGKIVKLYHKKTGAAKSRLEVLNQLLSQEIINSIQYASLKNIELTGDDPGNFNKPYSPATAVNIEEKFNGMEKQETKDSNDITKIAASLIKEGLEKVVYWLQDALLQACYVKLHLERIRREGLHQNNPQFPVMEPVPYHYALMGQPIPIVPWGVEEQCAVLQNTSFVHLLQCIGIQTPLKDGIGGIYPRIPTSLTPLNLLEAAKKLGELKSGKMKFDPAEVYQMENGLDDEEKRDCESMLFSSPTQPLKPPPISKSGKSNSRLEPYNSCSIRDRHSPQPSSSGFQNQMYPETSRTARSNTNWLNIVANSKSATLKNSIGPLKEKCNSDSEKDDTDTKEKVKLSSKDDC